MTAGVERRRRNPGARRAELATGDPGKRAGKLPDLAR